MADLRMEGEDLEQAIWHVERVLDELAHAKDGASTAADHVGHVRLASKVADFADAWETKRGRLLARLTVFRDALVSVRDTFAELDEQLAAKLKSATQGHVDGGGAW